MFPNLDSIRLTIILAILLVITFIAFGIISKRISINDQSVRGEVTDHDRANQILTIGSTTLKVEYLPKIIDLTGLHLIARKSIESNDRYKSRYQYKCDVRNLELIPDLEHFMTITGRIKVSSNNEIAILLYNEKLLPELSVTGYFSKDLGQALDQYSVGDTIQLRGVIFAIKFDWIGINNTEIIPNHLEGNRGTNMKKYATTTYHPYENGVPDTAINEGETPEDAAMKTLPDWLNDAKVADVGMYPVVTLESAEGFHTVILENPDEKVRKDLTHKELIKDLKIEEGFRSIPYKDTQQKWTIGYGRNLEGLPLSNEEYKYFFPDKSYSEYSLKNVLTYFSTHPMNKVQALYLLNRVIEVCESDAKRIYSILYDEFPRTAKVVILDLLYNLGHTRYVKFHRHIHAMKLMDYKIAALELRHSLAYKQDTDRYEHLAQQLEGLE